MTSPATEATEPLSVTIARARELSGLSTTTIYRMLANDELESTVVRGRRLVIYSSLKAVITKPAEKGKRAARAASDNHISQQRRRAAEAS